MDPAETTVQSLPTALLQRILQQLSLQERLGSTALVHSTWHTASIAATGSIVLPIPCQGSRRQDHLNSFLNWLHRYGTGAPQSLVLGFPSSPYGPPHLTYLCSTELQDLKLTGITLQLSANQVEQRQGALQPCNALTSLELRDCHLMDSARSMAVLAGMTCLQRLRLATCADASSGGVTRVPVMISSNFFARLDQLTTLQLEAPAVTADSFARLSCLTGLDEFVLDYPVELSQAKALQGWGAARQPRTRIVQAAAASFLPLARSLNQLTGLQHLALTQCQCDPAELTPLLLLQSLDLSGTRCSNTAALLGWVSQLQHLTSLDVQGCLQFREDAEPAPLTAYAALTASSALERLKFSCDDLPAGAWLHIFPVTRMLTRLSVLHAWPWHAPDRCSDGARVATQHVQGIELDSPPLSNDDMMRLTQCCPQLQQLQLSTSVAQEPGKALTALTGLTGLQELELNLLYYGERDWSDPQSCAWYQLLYAVLHNKAPTGEAPDVWLQLQDLCANPQRNTKTWDGSKWA